MKRKILFVNLAYYPNVDHGGPVRVMRNYALGLLSLGHEVTIFCSDFIDRDHNRIADHTVEKELDGVRVVYLHTNWQFSDGTRVSFDLERYLRREINDYDVVNIFGARSFFTTQVAFSAIRNNKPYILHMLGTMGHNNSKRLPKFVWDAVIGRRIYNKAKWIVESTEEQAKILRAYNIPDSRIAIVPWGPDPDLAAYPARRGQFRQRFGIAEDEKVILFLGRIHRKKRLDLVVKSLPLLKSKPVRLVVVGHDDDQSQSELKSLVKSLDLEDRVVWAGPIHSPESASAYTDADVFVLMSDNESAPMALLEACSMGLPVVISDYTGMSGMIDHTAGLVVDQSAEAIASALDLVFQNDELRRSYAEGCRALVEKNFSYEAVAAQLDRLYD